jgi:primary-amine oxidase
LVVLRVRLAMTLLRLLRTLAPAAILLAALGGASGEVQIAPAARATNPMDALTADEIVTAVGVLRASGKFDEATKLVSLSLDENPKAEIRSWQPGNGFARHAFAVFLRNGALNEARIDIGAASLLDWRVVPDRQAALTVEEFISASTIVMGDERWRAAMARRGIVDFADILCFPLATGPILDPALAGRRLLNVTCVDRSGADNNLWGKPIENVMAIVDAEAKSVVSLLDLGTLPRPPDTPSHRWDNSGRSRPALKPVSIVAPEGPNVTIDGGMVRWDKWSFHIRLDPRLGAVVSLVRFEDRGRARDIVYQLSASEMFVPYMDPTPTWSFRSYMDIGEYGFGLLSTELRPGRDCPESARFLDVTIADLKGTPVTLRRVVCVFERPTGAPIWRHDEVMNGSFEARVNTELVVRTAPVVGNYDYLIDYVFDRAANIDVRLGAFGIDGGKGVAASAVGDPTGLEDTAYGVLVAKRLVAVNHDHYMCFRIDFDVDGTDNRLVEDVFTPGRISADGPRRSIWRLEGEVIPVEGQIEMPTSAAQFRVESATAKNALGYATGYQFVAEHGTTSMLSPDDPVQSRAAFSSHALWVTAYAPDEKFAAGPYPNGSHEQDGLPKWINAKRSIDRSDLVLWHTVGFRHVPRAEDWPTMPGVWHGFRLRPFNFFDYNPAIDVPPANISAK